MTRHRSNDVTKLDDPRLLSVLFHPRRDPRPDTQKTTKDHLIPVEEDVAIGARFHVEVPKGPTILLFHGNGEIAADYDDLGPIYNQKGINFVAVDYRGYGRSNGQPSVSAMLTDSHHLFRYARTWLADHGFLGPLIVMGRSLGSASALELAATYPDDIDGLIIESGFAYTLPLLRLLGFDPDRLSEEMGFVNLEKIAQYAGPTLIIHAQYDHIIPFADGRALYEASAANQKTILRIEGADHNDILLRGFNDYMHAVEALAAGLGDEAL